MKKHKHFIALLDKCKCRFMFKFVFVFCGAFWFCCSLLLLWGFSVFLSWGIFSIL